MITSVEAVRRAFAAIAQHDRPEVWITLRGEKEMLAEALELDISAENLPLRGQILAVKDNIDVAGLPTTLGLPRDFAIAHRDAPAVARLRAAGAIVIGKTNLDQFATGLVGTRSPFGAVRNSLWPERISGGSSSGSAVAVALGMADLALGTDTAGSGRVPAALNRIVGIKPTLGLVPTTGMRDACRPFDTITVFARTLNEASVALEIMIGPDGVDGLCRAAPLDARLAAPSDPVFAIPLDEDLTSLDAPSRDAWTAALVRWAELGTLRPTGIATLLAAARLLYDGAIVAGRFAAAGEFMNDDDGLDPTVAVIVRRAESVLGWEYVRDRATLDAARIAAIDLLAGCDALLVPTAPGHPTIAEVAADPLVLNAWLGTFTNFVNLLDLAAVAVPVAQPTEYGFGVSVITRAFEDRIGLDLAARFLGERVPEGRNDSGIELAVFGAHLTGQPLNHELADFGARLLGEARTSADYRLLALPTTPPKPGLVEVAAGGVEITGELWRLAPAALGRFLARLPKPMTLGAISLHDGRQVVGFACSPMAAAGASDISEFGSWPAWLEAQLAT